MQSSRPRIYTPFEVTPYGYIVHLLAGDFNSKKGMQMLEAAGVPAEVIESVIQSRFAGLVNTHDEDRNMYVYIAPNKIRGYRTLIETVTHEAFHLTCRITERIQMPLTGDSEEAYAYLNGWLNTKIFELLRT